MSIVPGGVLIVLQRLRPFVEAEHPGAKDDPETKAWEEKMHREADDLKLESFGVEVCCSDLHLKRGSLLPAPPYHWQHLYHESHKLHEEPKDAWNVSCHWLYFTSDSHCCPVPDSSLA